MGHSYHAELRLVIKLCVAYLLDGLTPENVNEVMNLIAKGYVNGNCDTGLENAKEGYLDFFGILHDLKDMEYDAVINQLTFIKCNYGNREIFLDLKTISKAGNYGYEFTGYSHSLISIASLQNNLTSPYMNDDQESKYKIITNNFKHEITAMVRLYGGQKLAIK